jgi:hypothetical protein
MSKADKLVKGLRHFRHFTLAELKDLLFALEEEIEKREQAGEMETQKEAEPTVRIVEKYVKCGKPGCRCAAGQGHGPFLYRYWKEGGKTHCEYVGKPTKKEPG